MPFGPAITAVFGADTAPFAKGVVEAERYVDQLDARFKSSGVAMAAGPEKFAEASAKAFSEVFAGEQKISDFRASVAYRRMSDEQKLGVLRNQASALLTRILQTEGQSAEKLADQLALEQKKVQIYDLNQKILASVASETRAVSTEIAKQPGLMGQLNHAATVVKKAFADMGLEMKGMGVGVALAGFLSLGKEAIADAQKLRDALTAAGKPVDTATSSMAAFGDGIKAVKEAAVGAVGYLIGGYTQLGDVLGSVINRMRGVSEAQENIAVVAQREADLAEARAKKLREEDRDVARVAAAKKAADDAEKARLFGLLDDNQKMNALISENLAIREKIRNTEAGTVTYFERQKALTESLTKISEMDLSLAEKKKKTEEGITKALNEFFGDLDAGSKRNNEALEAEKKKREELLALRKKEGGEASQNLSTEEQQRAAMEAILVAAIAQARAQGLVTTELEKQLNLIRNIKPAVDANTGAWAKYQVTVQRTGSGYTQQSTTALEGVRDRLVSQLSAPSPNTGVAIKDASQSQDYGGWLMAATYKAELNSVENELSQRRSVAAYARQYGEQAAVYKFGDDLTNRALADLNSTQQRTATAVEAIATKFKNL